MVADNSAKPGVADVTLKLVFPASSETFDIGCTVPSELTTLTVFLDRGLFVLLLTNTSTSTCVIPKVSGPESKNTYIPPKKISNVYSKQTARS